MKLEVTKTFERDVKSISDKSVAARLLKLIEVLEQCENLAEVPNVRKISAAEGYYRIRLGDFRLGLNLESDTLKLIRFLNRKDIYRHFP